MLVGNWQQTHYQYFSKLGEFVETTKQLSSDVIVVQLFSQKAKPSWYTAGYLHRVFWVPGVPRVCLSEGQKVALDFQILWFQPAGISYKLRFYPEPHISDISIAIFEKVG